MKQLLLWTLAVVLMAASVIYQRATGPTQPFVGKLLFEGKNYKYKLLRTHETTAGAEITLPEINDKSYQAILHYKRYQTMDTITQVSFQNSKDLKFYAPLPVQPSAGKMEYFVTGSIAGKEFRIPQDGEKSIVLRYKDPVPNGVLIPHIFLMFFAVLFGLRAGLSAIADVSTMRKWVIISLIGMTFGGMMLGPMVQKYAFGEYWTGFPYGGDFTDNKMLILFLVWAITLALIGFRAKKNELFSRIVVLFAAIVMTVVYIIPHSMGGSTLDYSKVDQGIKPSEAIKTGR